MMMKDAFETLQVVRKEGDVVLVELCRPDVLNAMNTQMGRDLRELFMHLSANPHEARCIVLTGNGTRAFCAGGDLKERNGMTDAQWQAQHLIFEQAIAAVVACPIPIIAAVNGAAFGGGTEIALGCDFIYASSAARFALTEVTLGIIPGCGGTQNLPRALGERRAKELILSGTPFSADDAMKWGMVNRVCEPDKLLDEALATARRIAGNGPIAVRQAKHAIHHGIEMSVANGMLFEVQAYNRTVPTEDRHEGVRAFNEKRKPDFKGK